MNTATAEPVAFECEGSRLIGILHRPATPASIGVLLVVGGPQYRVGSHRQFVLLARALATAGFACLRFDYRGMGDSEGDARGFESIDADIRAAVDAYLCSTPEVTRVVLWGLCDAASAAMFYAAGDARICGLALVNPWARTDAGLARSYLRHYYLRRIFDPRAWASLLRAPRSLATAAGSVAGMARAAAGSEGARARHPTALPERMARGLERFEGPILLLLSGDDITAREFEAASRARRRWRRILSRSSVTRRELASADHTFSRREWSDAVAAWTIEWLRTL